mgnify:CR=1 FL=1
MTVVSGQRIPEKLPRLTLASDLGQDIDGGWWLRTTEVSRELAAMVTVLEERLGGIVDIKVNWSAGGPPNLTFYGGECKQPPVMAVCGRHARANLLIVSSRTAAALAVMVLRRAASLPVDRVHLDTDAFRVADAVVGAARTQRASLRTLGKSTA